MLFRDMVVDPATGRPRYGPDMQTWDIDETREVGEVFRELRAMSGLPVDIQIARRFQPEAELSLRGVVGFVDASIESDPGLRIEVKGLESVLLCGQEFVAARITPGFVDAVFRPLKVCVGRVNLHTWHSYPY